MAMYEQFFGLHARPFELTPDPRYLFLTQKHAEALAHLEYGLSGRKGVTVLIGEVGTGKTTLLRAALERISGSGVQYAHVANPTLTRDEFYELLSVEFGLSDLAAQSKARFLIELKQLVHERHQQGGVTALVVDEAQSLPFELLEEIRLLANLESDTDKLMQVVLVGQPELAARLNEPQLRQLKQRIALRCTLDAMSARETAAYIAGRIRIAGGESGTRVHARSGTRDSRTFAGYPAIGQRAVRQRAGDRVCKRGCADRSTNGHRRVPRLRLRPVYDTCSGAVRVRFHRERSRACRH